MFTYIVFSIQFCLELVSLLPFVYLNTCVVGPSILPICFTGKLGNLARYTPDGNILLSPVGNRVNAVDLVQGRWDSGKLGNCWGFRGGFLTRPCGSNEQLGGGKSNMLYVRPGSLGK